MTPEQLRIEQNKTTHGVDGALLGTDWVDLRLGDEQCPYVVRYSEGGVLCCALKAGHTHGHRDGYIGAQHAQSDWGPRAERFFLKSEQLADLVSKQTAARAHPAPYCVIPMCDGITPEARDYYAAVMSAAPQLITMASALIELKELGMANLLGDRIRQLEAQLAEQTKRTAEAEQFCEQAHLSALHNEARVAPLDGKLMVAKQRIADLERRLEAATVLIDEMLDTMPVEWDTNDWERRRADLNAAPEAPTVDTEQRTLDEHGQPRLHVSLSSHRMTRCQSDDDGACDWEGCPQNRDGEPHKSGRHCPLDKDPEDE